MSIPRLLVVALALLAAGARADETPGVVDAGLVEQVRSLALGGAAAPQRRVEVVVGQLDPRLRLAPCQSIEPYMPPNSKPWGKTRIGLRCRQGAVAWNVYLPVTVKVYGPALVLTEGAPAGHIVAATELSIAEVDLAEEAAPVVGEAREVVGRALAQALRPGQAVRQGHVKARQWFSAGETVRVLVAGSGFALESEGIALSNGIEGQPARVRVESGRILTGVPSGERRLEINL